MCVSNKLPGDAEVVGAASEQSFTLKLPYANNNDANLDPGLGVSITHTVLPLILGAHSCYRAEKT